MICIEWIGPNKSLDLCLLSKQLCMSCSRYFHLLIRVDISCEWKKMTICCIRWDIHLSHFLNNEFNSSMYKWNIQGIKQSTWKSVILFFLTLEQNFTALKMHQCWSLVGFSITAGDIDVDRVFDYPLLVEHCFFEGQATERADLLFFYEYGLLYLSLFL